MIKIVAAVLGKTKLLISNKDNGIKIRKAITMISHVCLTPAQP